MNRLVQQPAGRPVARKHYRDTIENPVNLESISEFLDQDVINDLKKIFPDNNCYIWGVTPKPLNISQWNQLSNGDVAVFCRNSKIFSYGITNYKLQNHDLAAHLWKYDDDGYTWEYIYFLENILPLDFTYRQVNQAIGYAEDYTYQRFV